MAKRGPKKLNCKGEPREALKTTFQNEEKELDTRELNRSEVQERKGDETRGKIWKQEEERWKRSRKGEQRTRQVVSVMAGTPSAGSGK